MDATLAMKLRIKDFRSKIQKILGMKVSERETLEMFKKYGSSDFEKTVSRDVTKAKNFHEAASDKSQVHDSSVNCQSYTLQQLFELINDRISIKTGSSLGDYRVKKAYEMFSDGKNTRLTKEQLKYIINLKLAILVPDHLIERIFEAMDLDKTGFIQTRQFVVAVIRTSLNGSIPSLPIEDCASNQFVKVQEPYATFDAQFLHLRPPPETGLEMERKSYTVERIEQAICDQVVQRTGKSSTLIQTLVRCFGDTRSRTERNQGITKDQMRYSLWTRFQMRVTDEEIDLIFKKYDIKNEGSINVLSFVEGVIKNHAMSKALMEEVEVGGSYADDPTHDNSINDLLMIIKKSIQQNVNREARSPHYILHSSSRMRLDQFITFISHKLRVDVQYHEKVIALVLKHYYADKLVDVRKMLYDAMSYSRDGQVALNARKRASTIIQAAELPCNLKGVHFHPEKVEEMLVLKINERAKNNNPLSTLHKLFKDGGETTKYVNRTSMQALFHRFDILVSNEDFEAFFKRHDRGDGLVEVRQFLKVLIPAPNHAENPLAPKAPQDIEKHHMLADQLSKLTGRRREVSSINGVEQVRFEKVAGGETAVLNLSDSNRPVSAYDISGNRLRNYREHAPTTVAKTDFFDTLRPENDPKDFYMNRYSTPGIDESVLLGEGEGIAGMGSMGRSSRPPPLVGRRPSSAPTISMLNQNYQQHQIQPAMAETLRLVDTPEPPTSPRAAIVVTDSDLSPREVQLAISQYKEKRIPIPPPRPQPQPYPPAIDSTGSSLRSYNTLSPRATQDRYIFATQSSEGRERGYNILTTRPNSAAPGVRRLRPSDDNQAQPRINLFDTKQSVPARPQSAPTTKSPRHLSRSPRSNVTNSGVSTNPYRRGTARIDPFNNILLQRYKVSNRNTTTNHEAYGLFVKNLQRVLNVQKKGKMQVTGFTPR